MTDLEDSHIAAVRALRALMKGEPGDVFAATCVSWHNFDEVDVPTNPDVMAGTQAALKITPDLRATDVVAHQITDELSVVRYRVRATFPDGEEMNAPGAMFVYTVDGQVVRTDEFLESAQSVALYAKYFPA